MTRGDAQEHVGMICLPAEAPSQGSMRPHGLTHAPDARDRVEHWTRAPAVHASPDRRAHLRVAAAPRLPGGPPAHSADLVHAPGGTLAARVPGAAGGHPDARVLP